MSGYRSSDTEIGVLAAKRFAKSSRSSSRATVVVRVSRRISVKSSLASPLIGEAEDARRAMSRLPWRARFPHHRRVATNEGSARCPAKGLLIAPDDAMRVSMRSPLTGHRPLPRL